MVKTFNILVHLAFWAGSVLLLTVSSLSWGAVINPKYDTLVPQLYGALTNAFLFYVVCYYLLPRFFTKAQQGLFYVLSFLLVLALTVTELYFDFIWWKSTIDHTPDTTFLTFFGEQFIYVFPINILYYLLAFGYRLPINRKLQEQKERALEKAKLHAELKYLKAQLDPHTLFNGMNSIYHLIDRDPAKAKDIVLRFSSLIRYQLYECDETFVDMDQEISYLHNYIALNTIRKEADATIDVQIDQITGTGKVPPLIFTPFIENGFKYLSSYKNKEENILKIILIEEEDHILFEMHNTVDPPSDLHNQYSGIGIKNSISRLDLLYGQKYELKYGRQSDWYHIYLKLPNTMA